MLHAARLQRVAAEAEALASEARSKELAELHAANARIATLAFAQAGRTQREAEDELRQLLEPTDSPAMRRLRLQLERVIERDARRRDEAAKRLAWLSWAAARPSVRSQPPPPQPQQQQQANGSRTPLSAERRSSSEHDAQCHPLLRGGEDGSPGSPGSPRSPAADVATREALAVADAKVKQLTALVADLTTEVENLTTDLIAAKLGQAELASAGLTIDHEKRQLEKQLVVESVTVRRHVAGGRTASPRTRRGLAADSPRTRRGLIPSERATCL